MKSKSMIGKYGKLCEIAGYHYLEQEGDTLEDKALKEIEWRKVNLAAIPNEKTLDAVYLAGRAGDLTAYAATINATTQVELKEKLTEVVDATIRDAAFSDKKHVTHGRFYQTFIIIVIICKDAGGWIQNVRNSQRSPGMPRQRLEIVKES